MQLGSAVSAPDIWVALAGGNCSGTVTFVVRTKDVKEGNFGAVVSSFASRTPSGQMSRAEAANPGPTDVTDALSAMSDEEVTKTLIKRSFLCGRHGSSPPDQVRPDPSLQAQSAEEWTLWRNGNRDRVDKRQSRNRSPSYGGPRVRIRLPPARSLLRT
jgi:hypothetical protein